MDAFVEFQNGRFAIGYLGKRRRMAVVVKNPDGLFTIFLPNAALRAMGRSTYELGQDGAQAIAEEKNKFYALYSAEKQGQHKAIVFVDGEKPAEKSFSVSRYEVKPAIDRYF